MPTYLIDYENVHHHGFTGIDKLTADDYVVIFVGNKNKTIPVDVAILISKTSANVVWKKSDKTASNYLDIQLASYLGSLVGEGKGDEFHIISKDQGFVAAVDFWTPRKPNMQFTLRETISGKSISDTQAAQAAPPVQKEATVGDAGDKLKPSIKKKAAAVLRSQNLIGGNFAMVYEIFKKTRSEQQFLSAIKTSYSGEKYKQLGAELLPIYREYLTDK